MIPLFISKSAVLKYGVRQLPPSRKSRAIRIEDFYVTKRHLIEPKILPLVTALNKTKVLKTVSSCEGHFTKSEQLFEDRDFAEVRFCLIPGIDGRRLQDFFDFIDKEFHKLINDVVLCFYIKYLPEFRDSPEGYVFSITLTPLNRPDPPLKKRRATDRAIDIATSVVKIAIQENRF